MEYDEEEKAFFGGIIYVVMSCTYGSISLERVWMFRAINVYDLEGKEQKTATRKKFLYSVT